MRKHLMPNQLKAAVILLGAYRELVTDVYDGEDVTDDEGNVKAAEEASAGTSAGVFTPYD